jgi:hypothetical protein
MVSLCRGVPCDPSTPTAGADDGASPSADSDGGEDDSEGNSTSEADDDALPARQRRV